MQRRDSRISIVYRQNPQRKAEIRQTISIKHCQQSFRFSPTDNFPCDPAAADEEDEDDDIWYFIDYNQKEVENVTWNVYRKVEVDESLSSLDYITEETEDIHIYLLGLEIGGPMCYLSRWFC